MILIAHRGNVYGPNKEQENSPSYIDAAISLGFDIEVDVWVKEDSIFLGHDEPEYQIDEDWLISRKKHLWVHCKNATALGFCLGIGVHCFSHNTDPYTITSQRWVWAYPGEKPVPAPCVCVMPEYVDTGSIGIHPEGFAAVCSDYVGSFLQDRQK